VDRPSSCRGDAKLYNIEQAAFAALRRARETARSTFTRDTNREGYFGGKKKFKKNPKKVLHLFSALDTSAGNPRKFEAKKGQKKVQRKSQKSLAFIFQS